MSRPHAPWTEHRGFAIGLKPIPVADWLEGGEADPAARKDALLAAHPGLVWGEAPGSRPAQTEAMQMIAAALGEPIEPGAAPPLYAAARRVPDDLVLMEKTAGVWRATALSLSAPTFFTVRDALGRDLAELHGPVPGFQDRLRARVERVFAGLREDLVLERRNWTLVNSGERFTPDPAPIRARIAEIRPQDAGRALHLRIERQTLRRLPDSGAALFTIRVWLRPLEDLRRRPGELAAFARAWSSAAQDFRAYKQLRLYDDLVAAFLRAADESPRVDA